MPGKQKLTRKGNGGGNRKGKEGGVNAMSRCPIVAENRGERRHLKIITEKNERSKFIHTTMERIKKFKKE